MRVSGRLVASVAVVCGVLLLCAADLRSSLAEDSTGSRTHNGLLVLYDFGSASGRIVKDRSGVGQPLDLVIENEKSVRRSAGALEVRTGTVIRSEQSATKIIDSIRRTSEITVEAWVQPAKPNQSGPARIVTLSKNTNERNFTLGQDGERFDARLRTDRTSANGIPSMSSPNKSLTTGLTHVIYSRDRAGRARIYVNGKRISEQNVPGNTSNWNTSFQFALANELSNDRPWLGSYYLVAVYSRSMSPQQIQQNFKAGAKATSDARVTEAEKVALARRNFETRIAPLFARHCLECHDAASKKGGLVLARKDTAFAGGESGKVIVPGKSSESLLWESVESNDMPADRPPLSAEEKNSLRQWIDAGATWSLDMLDPAIYVHEGRAAGNWVQRLTVPEYIETVRSAVGVDIADEARQMLPPDVRADGFANTAYNLSVDLKHVDAYSKLAEIIVERMDVMAFAGRFSKSRKLSTDDTMRRFVADMGKWLLRGPLEEREVTVYSGISTTVASAGGDYKEAVSYVIEAMLQSPRFIYRMERQQGDGGAWPVGQYELASRLSYIIWGAPPDAELMRAADKSELADRDRVAAQVKRMLAEPRAIERSTHFISQWLNLGRLDNMRPDPKRFPKWDPQLAADMRDETLAFFKEVAWRQNRPLSDLLNAQFTFATPRLADHYGLTSRDGKKQEGNLLRFDLSSNPGRGGLLTQGSMLTVGGDDASMVARGLFVLHDLLRGIVKDPPPCVNTTPVPTKPGLTQRAIAEGRIADTNCGGCHSKFEPLAFGLEKFDGLGTFREQDEHGNKLRDDGEVLFPGDAEPVKYNSSARLMNLLANSDRIRQSITWKMTQFALGRPLVATDAADVAKIHDAAQKNGGTYTSLITAIVMSDLVQMTRTEVSQ